MSSNTPTPAPAHVVADPAKPYKAYAGTFVTLLGLIWASLEGRDTLDNMTLMEWLSVIVPAVITFATIYGVTNPKVLDTNAVARDRGEAGAVDIGLALIVVGVIMAIVALLVAELAMLLWVGIVLAIVGVVMLVAGRSRA